VLRPTSKPKHVTKKSMSYKAHLRYINVYGSITKIEFYPIKFAITVCTATSNPGLYVVISNNHPGLLLFSTPHYYMGLYG
jgi:hypothetical protein